MVDIASFPLLSTIHSPHDLRSLSEADLLLLAREVRLFLLESVDNTGGHLSSGLGAVELTIALHHVFNTPDDNLIWDVGHQGYPHKILTGRMREMSGIRCRGGISGFPRRDESPYDAFGVGHSSTSISAALGMAVAAKNSGLKQKNVAVIGDGAMTAGMAFEALNHAGDMDADLIVILNDNNMSISPNVGGMSNYFAKVISGKFYSTMREGSKKVLEVIPPVWELAKRAEEHMKGMIVPGTLFEELGFNYIGPVDGHDIPTLVATLRNISHLSGPQFLHVVTKKGKGYPAAEADPIAYHAVTPQFYSTAEKAKSSGLTFTQVFSRWLCDSAAKEPQLIGITPAMREGSGLVEFAQQYPERYFDVGIAEQHAVTFAAGAACEGLKPVVAIYSSFLQRAYDQLIHDVAIQNLSVLFAIDRGGLVGADGATHSGGFDLSFLRCIPNMTILAPSNENECYHMLNFGLQLQQPVAVRYPRGKGSGIEITDSLAPPIETGKGYIGYQSANINADIKIAILNFGIFFPHAMAIVESLEQQQVAVTIADMRFVKPLDRELCQQLVEQNDILFTLEDNAIAGGAGSAVNELVCSLAKPKPIKNIGIPDLFPEHASQAELYRDLGLDSDGLVKTITEYIQLFNSKS